MSFRVATCLIVLAVLALTTLAQAAKSDQSFVSWLNGKQSSAPKALSASDYGAPARTVCLKETENLNCACNDNDVDDIFAATFCYNDFYFENKLACCGDEGINTDFSATLPLEVGQCDWVTDFLGYPYAIPTGKKDVERIGTFSVQCHLNHRADKCGHPLCDGMFMTGYGSMYNIENGFVDSLPDVPALDELCSTVTFALPTLRLGANVTASPVRRGADKSKVLGKLRSGFGKHGKAKAVGAATASHRHNDDFVNTAYRHHDHHMAYRADLLLFAGTFYVTNGDKSTKFDQGVLEYVYGYTETSSDPVHVEDDVHVATPYTVKLRFDGPADDKY